MAAAIGDPPAEFTLNLEIFEQSMAAVSTLKKPIAVVGHFPRYQFVAQIAGLRFFCLPKEEIRNLPRPEVWRRNQEFLNLILDEGGSFLLATPPAHVRAGSWFERELLYLSSLEAKFISPQFIKA